MFEGIKNFFSGMGDLSSWLFEYDEATDAPINSGNVYKTAKGNIRKKVSPLRKQYEAANDEGKRMMLNDITQYENHAVGRALYHHYNGDTLLNNDTIPPVTAQQGVTKTVERLKEYYQQARQNTLDTIKSVKQKSVNLLKSFSTDKLNNESETVKPLSTLFDNKRIPAFFNKAHDTVIKNGVTLVNYINEKNNWLKKQVKKFSLDNFKKSQPKGQSESGVSSEQPKGQSESGVSSEQPKGQSAGGRTEIPKDKGVSTTARIWEDGKIKDKPKAYAQNVREFYKDFGIENKSFIEAFSKLQEEEREKLLKTFYSNIAEDDSKLVDHINKRNWSDKRLRRLLGKENNVSSAGHGKLAMAVGAVVGMGALVHALSDSRGQQSNTQLYGQQPMQY